MNVAFLLSPRRARLLRAQGTDTPTVGVPALEEPQGTSLYGFSPTTDLLCDLASHLAFLQIHFFICETGGLDGSSATQPWLQNRIPGEPLTTPASTDA